jgi:hypothetical protein
MDWVLHNMVPQLQLPTGGNFPSAHRMREDPKPRNLRDSDKMRL